MKAYFKESLKYMLRSYPIVKRYVDETDRFYEMSSSELLAYKENRFLSLIQRAYTNSPFYKKLYDEAGVMIGDIKHVDDIRKLPVVTKDMVKKHNNDLLTCSRKLLVRNHTSGTSGSQLDIWESWESIWREQASLLCYRKRCGFDYGKDVLASLRGYLGKKDISVWVPVSKTLFLSSYNLRPECTQQYVEAIRSRCPRAIEGFPSSLYALACLLESQGLSLHIPICFTSSETILRWMREKIEKVLNTTIYDHYGLTERSIQLFESYEHNGYFESPGYSINEYETDHTITTSLNNVAFPLIRYYVDDAMELKPANEKPLTFGHISVEIEYVKGRAMSFVRGKDGTPYSDVSLTFVIRECTSAKYAQFVQYEDGHVELHIVTHEGLLPDNERKRIMELLDETIGLDNIDIVVTQVEESDLIITPRGKYRFVVNKKPIFGGVPM